jgi:cell division protein FtsL
MFAAKKSENSDRAGCTRTEKQLIAMLVVIVCAIVFLLVRH